MPEPESMAEIPFGYSLPGKETPDKGLVAQPQDSLLEMSPKSQLHAEADTAWPSQALY